MNMMQFLHSPAASEADKESEDNKAEATEPRFNIFRLPETRQGLNANDNEFWVDSNQDGMI